jgi:uncharacterized cupin superfamily protein
VNCNPSLEARREAPSHDERYGLSSILHGRRTARALGDDEHRVMPKIDIAKIPIDAGSNYPEPLRRVVAGRARKRLGNAAGLDQFGVNLTTLKPGAASALRHWHQKEDELVFILEGEVVLIDDSGETVLRPGDAAGFKANDPNGHHLVNKSGRDAVLLEIGTRSKHERAEYPDVDLLVIRDDKGSRYTRKNGEPYT